MPKMQKPDHSLPEKSKQLSLPPMRPAMEEKKPRRGFVYFGIRGNLIKIGFSNSPVDRLDQLKAKFLGCFPGTFKREKQVHRKFDKLRFKKEWFRADTKIFDYIEEHCEQVEQDLFDSTIESYLHGNLRTLDIPDLNEKTESVRLNKELLAQLRALAQERGAMVTWLVNKAVSQFLANEREVKP